MSRSWLRRKNFWPGQAIAFSAVGILLAAAAFLILIHDVRQRGPVTRIDQKVAVYMSDYRSTWGTSTMKVVTTAAHPYGTSATVLILAVWAANRRHSWRPFMLTSIALTGTYVLTTGVKLATARARPPGWEVIGTAGGYAFPSGHTTFAVTAAVVVLWLLWSDTKSLRQKIILLSSLFLFTVLVAFSRIYLGVHWISDIVGGYLLAAAWVLTLGLALAGKRAYCYHKKRTFKK